MSSELTWGVRLLLTSSAGLLLKANGWRKLSSRCNRALLRCQSRKKNSPHAMERSITDLKLIKADPLPLGLTAASSSRPDQRETCALETEPGQLLLQRSPDPPIGIRWQLTRSADRWQRENELRLRLR